MLRPGRVSAGLVKCTRGREDKTKRDKSPDVGFRDPQKNGSTDGKREHGAGDGGRCAIQ